MTWRVNRKTKEVTEQSLYKKKIICVFSEITENFQSCDDSLKTQLKSLWSFLREKPFLSWNLNKQKIIMKWHLCWDIQKLYGYHDLFQPFINTTSFIVLVSLLEHNFLRFFLQLPSCITFGWGVNNLSK